MEQLVLRSELMTKDEFVKEYYLDVDELPCKLIERSNGRYRALRDRVERSLNVEYDNQPRFSVRFGFKKPRLCSRDVFHYYKHPLQAIAYDSIHAEYIKFDNYVLLTVKPSGKLVSDESKCGCTKITLLEEIRTPKLIGWSNLREAAVAMFIENEPIFRNVDELYDAYLKDRT